MVEQIADAARAVMPSERVDSLVVSFPGDEDPVATLTLQVLAESDPEAREVGAPLYHAIMLKAGLQPDDKALLGTLTPIFGPLPHMRFLDEAERLSMDDRHEFAVLRAQTAAELFGTDAMHGILAGRLSPKWRQGSAGLIKRTLSDTRSRSLFEALTGSRPEHQPWWENYRRHLARRNAVVHQGLSVSADDARESIEAVRSFMEYLRRVWAGEPLRDSVKGALTTGLHARSISSASCWLGA